MTELDSQELMWNATLYFGFELTWNCIFIKCGVDHALCVHPLNCLGGFFLYLIKATLELFFFAFFVCMLRVLTLSYQIMTWSITSTIWNPISPLNWNAPLTLKKEVLQHSLHCTLHLHCIISPLASSVFSLCYSCTHNKNMCSCVVCYKKYNPINF